ncbi:endonuclease/exonuclease/phosphatase family protein [Cognatishimia sp. D5M38]|uniref:Endonuclease/exonuclease/phosphatase family protein n=1 Tax=Cognatishimia coralii TaxID=3083254 RepID=A0ABU8QIA6_9RHOB
MKPIFLTLALALAGSAQADTLRIATFNASLNRQNAGDLRADIKASDAQVAAVAEIIQRVRPDVLLLNEFDDDPAALALFQTLLQTGQNTTGDGTAQPITYTEAFRAPVNTGVPSGYDLDGNQEIGGPGDAYGFGFFPGQYGMAVLSNLPITNARTFQTFLWKDMPKNLMPNEFYSSAAEGIFRLSSKSHWDLTLDADGTEVHLLAAHPTPPVFDGPEDRNGRRNHDEIRFWADYVEGASYIYDDAGTKGSLGDGAHFVIAGDLNADPFDGDSTNQAILQLLDHPLIQASATQAPSSDGSAEAADRQGGANKRHRGPAAFDTADFGFDRDNPGTDRTPGNLRVDYVLPSKTLKIVDSGIYWLPNTDPLFKLAEFPTSDHRLVWIDVEIPE